MELKTDVCTDLTSQELLNKFKKDVDQLVHDIRSPLTSLYVLAEYSPAIPEKDRENLKKAATSISDLANNLMNKYKTGSIKQNNNMPDDILQPILVSILLSHLISEIKERYKRLPIKVDYQIAKDSHFAFIMIPIAKIRKTLLSIVETLVVRDNNLSAISVGLESSAQSVIIKIAATSDKNLSVDNSNKTVKDKSNITISNEASVDFETASLENIGVKFTVEDNNQDKLVLLTFDKNPVPSWIITNIDITADDTLIVLDDDKSMHNVWENRLYEIRSNYPKIKIHYFTDGGRALDFINGLLPEDKQKFLLLSDYELANQQLDGLEIIKKSGLPRTILVTAYFNRTEIQKVAIMRGTKILPKQLIVEANVAVLE